VASEDITEQRAVGIMAETFFIKLKEGTSRNDLQRVAAFLQRKNVTIVMNVSNCFIVAADQQLAELIRTLPVVERVGGVTVKRRKVKILRRPVKNQS
jgi:predicted NUDIX family NTP pyrophosphohydrolase